MRHIHIALVLLVCSVISLTFAKSTVVYRRYHRKRPSIRKEQKNVVEIVEVFKTNHRPPAHMKSDKSIEKFLLCDAKCERKRFLRRRRICLRTGRFCPTRPSGQKPESTTQINISTRPVYEKPTVYQPNPYGNQNPDYTHLYPWSRPSVTVTKYPPDRSKDFNMTIVEVNNDTVVTTSKYDVEYYDGYDNEDRYHQRRSTTFRVPTTIQQWTTPKMSTTETTQATTTVPSTTFITETSPPPTTTAIPTSTVTSPEPPETTEVQTSSTVATTRKTTSTLVTTSEFISPTTEPTTTMEATVPVHFVESTTAFLLPAPPTSIRIIDSFTETTTEIFPAPPTSVTVIEPSTAATTEMATPTTSEIATEGSTSTPSVLSIIRPLSTTYRSVEYIDVEVESTTPAVTQSLTTENQTEATTTENQTETVTTEQTEDDPDEYIYEDGEEEGGEEEGEEEGEEDVGGDENGDAGGENYDYEDDGNYDEEEQTEDQV